MKINDIEKIGVMGAGIMGTDVAFDLAANGYHVTLKDISENILDSSKKKIQRDFKFYKMMKKDYKGLNLDDLLKNIKFSLDYSDFDKVDLVIENIVENFNCKKKLYSELSKVCKDDVLYAINTSCISVTRIGSFLPNPSNVIGVHFMNPVPLKNAVETIKGYHTSDDTIKKISEFLKSINKKSIIVNDYPGFVANRLSHLFMNEAAYLIQDGVAEANQVDTIFKQCYGHKMGPLETADLIGLDTVVDSLRVLYESYQDSKFRCCPLLKKMVDAGLLGKKSGKGFYEY